VASIFSLGKQPPVFPLFKARVSMTAVRVNSGSSVLDASNNAVLRIPANTREYPRGSRDICKLAARERGDRKRASTGS